MSLLVLNKLAGSSPTLSEEIHVFSSLSKVSNAKNTLRELKTTLYICYWLIDKPKLYKVSVISTFVLIFTGNTLKDLYNVCTPIDQ